jgi:hypothetical protein
MPLAPTPAQSSASRANGAHSRGPVTPDGKARAARNGTAHGLTARTFALLPGEDPDEHRALLDAYLARHGLLASACAMATWFCDVGFISEAQRAKRSGSGRPCRAPRAAPAPG